MTDIPRVQNIGDFLTIQGYIAVPFRQNVAGHLLIHAKINGTGGIYILDSGAGRTVVDNKQLGNLNLTLNYDETELTGGGVGAHGLANIPSYGNKLEIDLFKIDDFALAVMSLETAWEALAKVGAHDEITGIIGVDILKAGSAVVDFNTMTLYLLQPAPAKLGDQPAGVGMDK